MRKSLKFCEKYTCPSCGERDCLEKYDKTNQRGIVMGWRCWHCDTWYKDTELYEIVWKEKK